MAKFFFFFFFASLWTERKLRSIKMQKRTRPISSYFDWNAWSIKNSLFAQRVSLLRDKVENLKRER